jgi:hypothetical protein
VARGEASSDDLAAYWNASTYSFPRGALRLRWLEEKEQGRATALFGRDLHHGRPPSSSRSTACPTC